MKKGQAAIEYLISYGWTILVILITVGVIIYFDILSPIKFLPEQCEFGEQVKCIDMQLFTNGEFQLKLLNNFPKPILIVDMAADNYQVSMKSPVTCIGPSVSERIQGSLQMVGTGEPMEFGKNEKQQMRIKIEFERASDACGGIGAPTHEIRGVFVTGAEECLDLTCLT